MGAYLLDNVCVVRNCMFFFAGEMQVEELAQHAVIFTLFLHLYL